MIGTERHESENDNQLRGRAGRQETKAAVFYLSFEDELMRRFGGDNEVHDGRLYERRRRGNTNSLCFKANRNRSKDKTPTLKEENMCSITTTS